MYVSVYLNKSQVHNPKPVLDAAYNRPKGVPLITISNHMSCCDDPMTFGALLPLSKFFVDTNKFRWLLGAKEICFTQKSHSIFFRLGKVVPVVRGDGVYQKTMNEMLNELNKGDWLHIFSEGKINMENEILGLRWGLGRLVADCDVTPIVVVLFHQGHEKILPNEPPYVPQINKKITLLCGEQIDLRDFVRDLKASKKTPVNLSFDLNSSFLIDSYQAYLF